MKELLAMLSLVFVALLGCAHDASLSDHISVDSLVESASRLEGQQVTVSGYLRFGDDSRNLWSSKIVYMKMKNGSLSASNGPNDHCIALFDIADWRESLLSNNGKDILVSGVVRRIPLKEGEISLSECSDLGVAIRSIQRK